MDEIYYWRGKNLQDLSKEELIEAVIISNKMLLQEMDSYRRTIDILLARR